MLNLARKLVPISLIAFVGCSTMMNSAGVSPSTTDMGTSKVAALTWTDLVVPGFPTGGKMAVLSGNPGAAEAYVLRLQLPDGYEFPEHWHPGTENLTVLSGSFHLAMGGAMTGPMKEYAPGDFIYIPARSSHLGGAKGTTVIQLHGIGPFAINVGRP